MATVRWAILWRSNFQKPQRIWSGTECYHFWNISVQKFDKTLLVLHSMSPRYNAQDLLFHVRIWVHFSACKWNLWFHHLSRVPIHRNVVRNQNHVNTAMWISAVRTTQGLPWRKYLRIKMKCNLFSIYSLCWMYSAHCLEFWSPNDVISPKATLASHRNRCDSDLLWPNRVNWQRLLERRRNTFRVYPFRSICTASRLPGAGVCSLAVTSEDNCRETESAVVRAGSCPALQTCIYKCDKERGRRKLTLKLSKPFSLI